MRAHEFINEQHNRVVGLIKGVTEAFDKPYRTKLEKSEYGDIDMLAKLPDGTNLSIMFNKQQDDEGKEVVQVEFYRNNSQEVTGEGDAQRIFATALASIQKYIKKYKPSRLSFSASKVTDPTIYYEPGQPQPNPESRAKLYDRLVQRYARDWGYRAFRADTGDLVIYELSRLQPAVAENFADDGRKGLAKRVGDREVELIKKLGQLGTLIVQNPKLWSKYSAAIDTNNVDWIIALIQDKTGANKEEVMHLSQLFGEIGGGLGRLEDFAWAVKEGTWVEDFVEPWTQYRNRGIAENFADGRKPGRKGLAKRVGVNCKQPISKLRSIAKNSSGEKQRMAHWCANMKSGRKK